MMSHNLSRLEEYVRVDIVQPISDYNYVLMRSERASWENVLDNPYTTIWLNIDRVIYFTKLGEQPWPAPFYQWTQARQEFFINAWRPELNVIHGKLAFMPRISVGVFYPEDESWFERAQNAISKVFIRQSRRPSPDTQVITFGNGRHRVEFLRAQGVKMMPFEVRASQAEAALKLCSDLL